MTMGDKIIELRCEACFAEWKAAEFPLSLGQLNEIINSHCPACGSDELSVMELPEWKHRYDVD